MAMTQSIACRAGGARTVRRGRFAAGAIALMPGAAIASDMRRYHSRSGSAKALPAKPFRRPGTTLV
jgi:hypothetical protein